MTSFGSEAMAGRRWLRRSAAPDDVRSVLPPGERVLAWGRELGGRPVVASAEALYVPDAEGGHTRLPFGRIAKATWSDPLLEVVLVSPQRRRFALDLSEAGELPPTVRERVMSTIVVSERVAIDERRGALVTARRVPGQEALAWSVVFDAGLDPDDPELRARADAAITALRAVTGL